MIQIADEHITAAYSSDVPVALKFRNNGAWFFIFLFLNIAAFQN